MIFLHDPHLFDNIGKWKFRAAWIIGFVNTCLTFRLWVWYFPWYLTSFHEISIDTSKEPYSMVQNTGTQSIEIQKKLNHFLLNKILCLNKYLFWLQPRVSSVKWICHLDGERYPAVNRQIVTKLVEPACLWDFPVVRNKKNRLRAVYTK